MKRLWVAGLFSAGLLALAGCDDHAVPETLPPDAVTGAPAPAPPNASSGIPEPTRAPPPQLAFSVVSEPTDATNLREVRDLVVYVHVSGTWASNDIGVEFISPSGNVYERQARSIEDSLQSEQVLAFRLPVAGTFITANAMSGIWQARVWMNGLERAAQPFELKP